jgi:hypothetical protein
MRNALQQLIGLGVLLAAICGMYQSALARQPLAEACKGTDLIDELSRSDPAGHARIIRQAAEIENSHAVFWLIEKDGVEPSYLLGTVHLTDDRVKRLPIAAEVAFTKAEHVAVETFYDSEEDIQKVLEAMPPEAVSSIEDRLSQHLSKEEFGRLVRLAAAAEIAREEVDQLRPWVAEMLVREPNCESRRIEQGELVLDAWLAGRALRRGMPLRKLETVTEQFETLASIPYDQQLAMLRYALSDRPSRGVDETETMIGLYLRRQIPAADALTRMLAPDSASAQSYLSAYWGDLINRRNHRFVANARPMLDKGRVFIAIGAAHLPGPEGVVALLRAAGYRLTAADDGPGPAVVASAQKPAPKVKQKVRRKPVKHASTLKRVEMAASDARTFRPER